MKSSSFPRLLGRLALILIGGQGLAGATEPAQGFGLIAHWSFDADYASSVNDAFYRGEARGGLVGIDRTAGVARVGAGALRITSARGAMTERGYVAVENPLWGETGTGVLCVTGWFKLQDVGSDGMDTTNLVCESFPTLSSFGLGTRTQAGKKVATFRFRTSDYRMYSEAPVSASSTPSTRRPEHTKISPDVDPVAKPGEWQHVAVIWNGPVGRIRFYLGGRLQQEIAIPAGTRLEFARGLHIGTNRIAGGSDWDGWIDDLAVFDVELSAKQILTLAERTLSGREVSAANVLAVVSDTTVPAIAAAKMKFIPPAIPAPEASAQGPLIGHVSEGEAVLWARVPHRGTYTAVAKSADGRHTVRAVAEAVEASDWCLHFKLKELKPATEYAVTFERPAGCTYTLAPLTVRVPPPVELAASVTLGFGSCSDFPDSAVWTRIAAECRDGMVLLGDTPYIDTTELRWVRWAYRRFASTPQFAAAFRQIPFWGTWDDHDFGRNDSDGTLPGKEFSRQAFLEYRPNLQSGEDGQGVYTRFRRGPVEVFVLDTRWFSRAEKSWADPKKPTLLGARQWEWLRAALKSSTAPFKVLASGMIWDGKGDSGESDAWGAYAHERDALYRWLGENRITGVVLIGGDIHISRHMKYATRDAVGYDLHQFIVSPLNDRVIPGFDTPDPAAMKSFAVPNVFLKLAADSTQPVPTLHAQWMDREGRRIFEHTLAANELERGNAPTR
ncbi:MAG: alkaline phosphatase D family protein [Verrucomicrobiota bacterium]